MLVHCLYASRASRPLTDDVLDQILKQSRKNNLRTGITGMLCYANDVFVQVIEGGRTEVGRLFCKIARDERNCDLEILSFEEIAQRRFSGWTMGQVNIAGINPALLLKYSEKITFDPFACTGAATMALVDEIASSGAIANRTI